MSDPDETTKLKKNTISINDDAAQYAALGGSNEFNPLPQNTENEFIAFDFMINVSSEIIDISSLKTAIKESVDCTEDQIKELKLTDIDDGTKKKSSRINGKIYTDDWELPMLQKKFKKIISDRVLSTKLQKVCNMEDRPMIRRFFSKTSKNAKNNVNKLKQTESLRILKDETNTNKINVGNEPNIKNKGKLPDSVPIDDNNNNQNRAPPNDECDCFCFIQ